MTNLTVEEQQALYLIESDLDHARYFFVNAKSSKWFYPLKLKKYYCVDSKCGIRFDQNNDALYWPVLSYLERISLQVKEYPKKNKSYGEELLKIVNDIVEYSQKRRKEVGKPINNYHVWWSCVKILINIPNGIFLDAFVPKGKYNFRSWLIEFNNEAFTATLPIEEIGGKLLTKFLEGEKTLCFAEEILDVITDIKRGGERPKLPLSGEDAILKSDPYWLLKSFEHNNKLIAKKCSVPAILRIADKLKNALEYKKIDIFTHLEVGKDIYRLMVSRVPLDGLEKGNIGFEDFHYEAILYKFSEKQTEGVDKNNDIQTFFIKEPAIKLKTFSFEANDGKQFISAIKDDLPKDVNWEAVEHYNVKLGNLYTGLFEDYSNVWCKTLKTADSSNAFDAEETLTVIFRDILLQVCKLERIEAKGILETLLSVKYPFPIFKKFVLLCVDMYWDNFSSMFEKFINTFDNAFEKDDWEIELQDILENHNKDRAFETVKDKIIELLSKTPEYYKDDESLKYFWRYRWLSPLKNHPDFSDLYNEAKGKSGQDKPYDPKKYLDQERFVGFTAPLSKEQILNKSVAELADYFKTFEGTDIHHGAFQERPSREGLAEVFQTAIRESPRKYVEVIDAFHNVPHAYVYRLLMGLKEAWADKKDFDWGTTLNFCNKYLTDKKDLFLADYEDKGNILRGQTRCLWIISTIADLIEEGSKDDKWAFGEKYFDLAEQVFESLIPLLRAEKNEKGTRSAIDYALNTPLGSTAMAYILFSLHVARVRRLLDEKWSYENWGKTYEHFLKIGAEAYTWLGRFLPSIRFLDEKYADDKIKEFSKPDTDNQNWHDFMEGYLLSQYVYDNIYQLMRPNYIKAVESVSFKETTDKNLVEHVAIGYLRGYECLEGQDSLFQKILNEANTPDKRHRWIDIAKFFWSISKRTLRKETLDRKKPPQNVRQRVIDFWKWTVKNQGAVKDKLDADYPAFLRQMADLTIMFDRIDEGAEECIMLSVPYIGQDRNPSFFVEYLASFKDDESVKRIGKIYRKLLDNATPTFRKEDIIAIVERLYKLGKKEPSVKNDADFICNTYGRRGEHFLKEIWQKNQ